MLLGSRQALIGAAVETTSIMVVFRDEAWRSRTKEGRLASAADVQATREGAEKCLRPVLMAAESIFPAPPGTPLQREPFRLFFPLGAILAWVGVGHWILYAVGATSTYSCLAHGAVQVQGFLLSFAVGFLLTALPRRTSSPPPQPWELAAIAVSLVVVAGAAMLERFVIAESAYALVFLLVLRFAVTRFLGRAAGRRPPAAFVLIPIAVAQGLGGAVLLALAATPFGPPWAEALGRLLVGQGVFLCFVMGVGSLILPLMGGAAPPPDLGSSPRETRKALAYGIAGATVFASFLVEQSGAVTFGPLLRALAICAAYWLGGALRPPGKPGLHRRFAWLAVWMIPLGLVGSALWPDYRVAALHVVFIGGFGLLAFAVATHVSLTHLGLAELALGRPLAVEVLGASLLLALLARLAADWSDAYFEHLVWAASIWIVGTGFWLAFLAPKLWRHG